MNTRIDRPQIAFFKVIVVLASLSTALTGCRALSDRIDPDKSGSSQNLPSVKRDQPNLTAQPAPIKVDPDSDKLVEDPRATNPNPPTNAGPNPENAGSGAGYKVTFDGLGPIKIGMTVAQAEQALGARLVRAEGYADACYFADPEGMPGVRLLVTNQTIARIDLSSASYATDKGAKVGDTEVTVLENLYPNARVEPQRGEDKTRRIAIYSENEQFMIMFETDGERVTGISVGKLGAVLSPKGCS